MVLSCVAVTAVQEVHLLQCILQPAEEFHRMAVLNAAYWTICGGQLDVVWHVWRYDFLMHAIVNSLRTFLAEGSSDA